MVGYGAKTREIARECVAKKYKGCCRRRRLSFSRYVVCNDCVTFLLFIINNLESICHSHSIVPGGFEVMS